jgi:hypothetical protein
MVAIAVLFLGTGLDYLEAGARRARAKAMCRTGGVLGRGGHLGGLALIWVRPADGADGVGLLSKALPFLKDDGTDDDAGCAVFRLGARAHRPAARTGDNRTPPPWPGWWPNCPRARNATPRPSPTSPRLRVALDQDLVRASMRPLAGVREVAFFPPMTGG